jgi:septal ring factor EnvC (AmiA/AmiB activator)
LSKLNWHPVAEIEMRSIVREQRMQQLESEILQVEREILQVKNDSEQIESDISRLAELNARIDALWPSSNSSSAPTAPPEEGSQT